jgi:iron complex outermembrane receptor protein
VKYSNGCGVACFEIALAFCAFAPRTALAQAPKPPDLTQLSLEDLMNIRVVSVSRKEQKLSKAGAAIFVITQDDIHRSGAQNIPDVLRMAPGVNVARIDANAWAISIRGFNSRYSDKILVLIDGRSIYSPAFSGVYWDQIDVPLEDIERIEVIRGPGGTVWGANAVNGVINIITMSSKATQGALVVAEAGSQESGSLTQYGGTAGAAGTYRAFGRYSTTDSSMNPAGGAAADGWHEFHGGFRADLALSPQDKLMVQGDVYQSAEGQTLTAVLSQQLPAVATFNDPISVASGDLQARWSHTLDNGSDTSLNVYYNHVNRLDQGQVENSNTFDIDFQHHIALNSRNDVVWGLSYRVTDDKLTSGYDNRWFPPQRTESLYSVFVQDEIKLAENAWLTVGSKFEHNGYTGFASEPGAQFVWAPTARQTIWLSASQAIRQPSRQDTDIQLDAAIIPLAGGNFGVLQFNGNKNIKAEQLRDYEVGYRAQVTKRLSLAASAFRSYYRHLETSEPAAAYFVETPGSPHFVFPYNILGAAHARSYGGELLATWNVTSRWRLSPTYSLLRINVIQDPLSQAAATVVGDAPEHQIQLRSSVSLRSNVDWDTSLYFVGRIADAQIPSYTRLDTQIRWHIGGRVEFSLAGQNLLRARHVEFADTFVVDYTQVQRSVLGKITWRF